MFSSQNLMSADQFVCLISFLVSIRKYFSQIKKYNYIYRPIAKASLVESNLFRDIKVKFCGEFEGTLFYAIIDSLYVTSTNLSLCNLNPSISRRSEEQTILGNP